MDSQTAQEAATADLDDIKGKVRSYWDHSATFYDTPAPGWQGREEMDAWKGELTEVLGTDPRDLLDVGCGTGFLTFALHELGHRMTGIDLSPGMMSIAEKRAAPLPNPPQFRLGDAEVLPFPDRSFDGVVCRYALWNLPRPEVALREWIRVVKPGGLILVIDGVWVYQGWLSKLAGVMRTIHRTLRERRRIGFDAELQRRLPFSHGIRLDDLEALMTEAGIAVAGTRDLQALRVVQQRSLVWYLRYSFTWPTHMVWGRTAGMR